MHKNQTRMGMRGWNCPTCPAPTYLRTTTASLHYCSTAQLLLQFVAGYCVLIMLVLPLVALCCVAHCSGDATCRKTSGAHCTTHRTDTTAEHTMQPPASSYGTSAMSHTESGCEWTQKKLDSGMIDVGAWET